MAKQKDKKKQAQLAFSPLPSSSPARANQPEAIRERAAAITLDMRPRAPNKRKLDDYLVPSSPQSSRVDSSQARKSTKITSSPVTSSYGRNFMQSSSQATTRGHRAQRAIMLDSDDEDILLDANFGRTGEHISSDTSPEPDEPANPGAAPGSDSDALPDMSAATKGTKAKSKRSKKKASMESDEDVVSPEKERRKKKKREKKSRHATAGDDSPLKNGRRKTVVDLVEDEDEEPITRTSRNKSQVVEVDQDEEEEPVTRSSRKKRSNVTEVEEGNEDEPMPRSSRRKSKVEEVLDDSDDEQPQAKEDEDEEDQPISTQRRRLARRAPVGDQDESPTRKSKTRTREDLDEDLDFLNDSDSYARRPSQTPKKTAKQKALETLRKKRGKPATTTPSRRGSRPVVLSDDGEEEDEEEEDDKVDSSADDESFSSDPRKRKAINTRDIIGRPITDPDSNGEDYEEEADFIVSDPSEVDSSAEAPSMPMQFTRYATMKPEELFKYIVEWMVQKKINPAFAMGDDVYRMAYARLNDFVQGMGGSKFKSSIWTGEFSKELMGRPNQEERQGSALAIMHGCDACNRTSHPATFEVRFHGKHYDKETLEEEEDSDDDSDEEASSSSSSSDSDDAEDAPLRKKSHSSKTYYLGSFCAANARKLHVLTHWRYHLNEWVIDYMTSSGYLTPELIVKRDKWSTKKRRKYANEIVDAMEADGEIKRLHKDFRREVNVAQTTNEGRYGGGGME